MTAASRQKYQQVVDKVEKEVLSSADASGKLMTRKLPDADLAAYRGVLGHYHIQTNKVDPGPALQWDYVIGQARRWMKQPALKRDVEGRPLARPSKLIVDN